MQRRAINTEKKYGESTTELGDNEKLWLHDLTTLWVLLAKSAPSKSNDESTARVLQCGVLMGRCCCQFVSVWTPYDWLWSLQVTTLALVNWSVVTAQRIPPARWQCRM